MFRVSSMLALLRPQLAARFVANEAFAESARPTELNDRASRPQMGGERFGARVGNRGPVRRGRQERSINRVELMCRIGRQPMERGQTTILSVVTNDSYADSSGDMVTQPEFTRVYVGRPTLRDFISKNLGVGDRVFIEGRLKTANYEREDGSRFQIMSVRADELTLMQRRFDGEKQRQPAKDDIDEDYGTEEEAEQAIAGQKGEEAVAGAAGRA